MTAEAYAPGVALFGRDDECCQVDALLACARSGVSGSLVVTGEPGIGKTALLAQAEANAQDLLVLKAQGIESESELAFAGLADLLGPVLPLLPSIPEPQAAALAGSLALGPPVRGDRFAVAAATLSLLGAAADDQPVLCLVDDAQWLDPSSLESLVFTARRLRAEGVVLLFGVREGSPAADRFTGLPCLPLRGLPEEASRLLLGRAHPDELSAAARDGLVQAAGGNPLGLLELPRQLSAAQRAGREPLYGPLRVGPALERSFRDRVEDLPRPSLRALLVLAASDLTSLELLGLALDRAGATLSDLDPAEAAGLVHVQPDEVVFRHPLMRSVVYQGASPVDRRWAHGLLAETLRDADVPQASERRVWHLIAAALRPDAGVASAVEEAAVSAVRRRSFSTATTLFERAAQLTPVTAARPARLLAGAQAAVPAGCVDQGLRLLEQALLHCEDPVERAAVEHQLCQLQLWSDSPLSARDRLLALAKRTQERDPGLAAVMVLSACQAAVVTYDHAAVSAGASWAAALAPADQRIQLAAAVLRAFAHAQAGDCAAAVEVLRSCEDQLRSEDPLAVDQLVLQAGVCWLALEHLPEARVLLERAVSSSRAVNAAGSLAMQLPWLTTLNLLEGRWNEALADAHDALRLIEETGWTTYRPTGLSVLARVEAGMGRPECREHAESAIAVAQELGTAPLEAHARAALGLFELGQASYGEAADQLEEALRIAGDAASPLLRVQLLPDLVEACVRSGRTDRAAALLDALDDGASCTGRTSALALAARCRALVRGDDEDGLRLALALHERGTPAFDRARTQLCLGQLLRRQKRRAEARDLLVAARETFRRLGAAGWLARVELDVVASGGPRRSGDAAVAHHLTPQELQVALTVAKGLSNAETASALFLSVKTVEYHLSNAYRKLGVRSRTQLVHELEAQTLAQPAGRPASGGALAR